MQQISDYILLDKIERQTHLRLDEPCIERGGPQKGGLSSYCKGLMAHLLDTTIPTGHKIHICHACNNGLCSNPNHLYWGTAQENRIDQIENGKDKTIYQRSVEKYGIEGIRQINTLKMIGNTSGAGNKGKQKSTEHRQKIAESIKLHWIEKNKALVM